MSCKYCKSEKENVNTSIGEYSLSYCTNCFNYENTHCKHENSSPVKYIQSGRWFVKMLCNDCNTLHGMFLKQAEHDFDNLRIIDKGKYDSYILSLSKRISDLIDPIREKRDEWNKLNWHLDYSEYLNSQKWKAKRLKVLERDNYLCQSCRVNKATEVHHLNYTHKGNEPLFDLVSVCHDCHETITLMDRKLI